MRGGESQCGVHVAAVRGLRQPGDGVAQDACEMQRLRRVCEDRDVAAAGNLALRFIAGLCALGASELIGGVLSPGSASGVQVRAGSVLRRTEPLLPESLGRGLRDRALAMWGEHAPGRDHKMAIAGRDHMLAPVPSYATTDNMGWVRKRRAASAMTLSTPTRMVVGSAWATVAEAGRWADWFMAL